MVGIVDAYFAKYVDWYADWSTLDLRTGEAQEAIDARAELYEHPETGLKSQFHQAKAAVASQFGRRSTEFATVSSIRY
jgi:hypothetical protein